MIDRLLGRAELKERIDELEAENHHLERRAAAEEERRSEAVADRQRAERRVNELEHRIESLEDRLERAGDDEASVEFRRVNDARGRRSTMSSTGSVGRKRRSRGATHGVRSRRRRGPGGGLGVVWRPHSPRQASGPGGRPRRRQRGRERGDRSLD